MDGLNFGRLIRCLSVLAGIAIILHMQFDYQRGALSMELGLDGILSFWEYVATGATVFAGSYLLFEKVLWRTRMARWTGFIDRPDLNGEWKGVRTSLTLQKNLQEGYKLEGAFKTSIRITQTLNAIRFVETNFASENGELTSINRSIAVNLRNKGPHEWRLYVLYENEPVVIKAAHGARHLGCLALDLLDSRTAAKFEGLKFSGRYWTDKETMVVGEVNNQEIKLEIKGTMGEMKMYSEEAA